MGPRGRLAKGSALAALGTFVVDADAGAVGEMRRLKVLIGR